MTTHTQHTTHNKHETHRQEREKRKELHYFCCVILYFIIIIIINLFCCCQLLQHNCSFLRHYHPVCPILYYQGDYFLCLSHFEAKSPHPNKLFIFPKNFCKMAVGPFARIIAQIVVPVVAVLARALPAAYAQALQNARKSGVDAAEAAKPVFGKRISRSEAIQVLNLTEEEVAANPEAVQKVRPETMMTF
jgi:hypothetical protein